MSKVWSWLLSTSVHINYLSVWTGDEVIRKGTEGNVFYIIKEGTMRVTDVGDGKSYPDHDLGPGDYFGERALLTGEPRAANIRATSSVVLMALDRLSFDTLLGPLKDVLNQNMIIRVLNSLKFFDNLSPNMKIRLAKAFEVEFFPAGELSFFSSLNSTLLHSTQLYLTALNSALPYSTQLYSSYVNSFPSDCFVLFYFLSNFILFVRNQPCNCVLIWKEWRL